MQWLQDALPAFFGPSQDARKNFQTTDMLLPDQLRQFFKACEETWDEREVKARLQDVHRAGKDVSAEIESIQRAIFERQGVAGDWGISCLGSVIKEYKGNPELLSVFYAFVSKEEEVAEEAELPAGEFRKAQIFKQQMQQQQAAQQRHLEEMAPAERERFQSDQRQQVAELDAKLRSLPEHERMAYLQQHLVPAQAAAQRAAEAGSAMTQARSEVVV